MSYNSEIRLSDLLNEAIESTIQGLHFCTPGEVVEYEPNRGQRAKVKPLLRRKLADGTVIPSPVIVDVPVVWPRGGGGQLHMPLRAGDGVLLVFSDKSLDAWMSTGGESTPSDDRFCDLSDAIALPGLNTFDTNPVVQDVTKVVLGNADGFVAIDGNGRLSIGNSRQELLTIIDELFSALMTTTVPTMS
jgi:hypothetical protein